MKYLITRPQHLSARVELPRSKSLSNRALIIGKLCGASKDSIKDLSDCDDTFVMQRALNILESEDGGQPSIIDVQAAGTSMRFLTALLSVTPGVHIITGTERMRKRPIGVLVDALRKLGANISYVENEGYPPLRIEGGKLNGGSVELAGNVSSQYVSALLMIGPTLEQGLTLHLTGEIVSLPYINMTLALMKHFGAVAEWADECTVSVHPQRYNSTINYTVEADWSAASYWFEMLALADSTNDFIELPGANAEESLQGDSWVADAFKKLGVDYMAPRYVRTNQHATRLEEDFTECPDLAQTFVVTCCMLNVPFRFTGLQSLRIKETDRISALQTELRKLGYVVDAIGDCEMTWSGQRCQPEEEPVIKTYDDHRMAMAFAPIALIRGSIFIENPEVVSKSYPQYWEHLIQAGFTVTEC